MWSETIGFRKYRHPYLPGFFRGVAEAIPLTGTEDLLDLGCGVGEVALGFAPFVASLTGMDLEQPMLDALGNRALAMGFNMKLSIPEWRTHRPTWVGFISSLWAGPTGTCIHQPPLHGSING
jgi:SAM-dependent methyltransferase